MHALAFSSVLLPAGTSIRILDTPEHLKEPESMTENDERAAFSEDVRAWLPHTSTLRGAAGHADVDEILPEPTAPHPLDGSPVRVRMHDEHVDVDAKASDETVHPSAPTCASAIGRAADDAIVASLSAADASTFTIGPRPLDPSHVREAVASMDLDGLKGDTLVGIVRPSHGRDLAGCLTRDAFAGEFIDFRDTFQHAVELPFGRRVRVLWRLMNLPTMQPDAGTTVEAPDAPFALVWHPSALAHKFGARFNILDLLEDGSLGDAFSGTTKRVRCTFRQGAVVLDERALVRFDL